MISPVSISSVAAALILSPLLRSIINRTKAGFAGRQGPPWLQPYYDLIKLLRKGAVYSRTTTWIFRASPVAGLTMALGALCLTPMGGENSVLHFEGDLLLFAYMLGLWRFFTILAAMDTGSSFEGMGASREAFYSALAEPALLLGLEGLALKAQSASLSGIYAALENSVSAGGHAATLIFIMLAFLIIYLTENARIPVDDPTTHLELTMIHEVMVLDHCGVDLAIIEYAGALKLWILGLLITGLFVPIQAGATWLNLGASILCLFLLAVLVGVIESVMARFKLVKIPQLLTGAFVLAALWGVWIARTQL
ncbi:NADH-quinone oxidoreductase subunit H [Candidatus Sumerlaeota bacterium]|nr:NADH-quinone oxidoreductase subunit H [Candidatus Sumerlaeota bacterium]